MKIKTKLKYDKLESRYYGNYLKFKEGADGSYCIINNGEELLGHLEKIRCGAWMHWCILLEDGCYLSPGCVDEAREMQRVLGTKPSQKTGKLEEKKQ